MSGAYALPVPRPWLFHAPADLLFGCGLVSLLALGAQALAGPALREALPMAWTPFLVLLTGIPHYGATLLRAYEQRADRRRYFVFSTLATAFLALLFVAGTRSVMLGSALVTIYLTWSPWHYSGQNYGIALMFLRRRGVEVTPLAQRALQTSFVLSFLLTAVMLHAHDSTTTWAPGSYEGAVYDLVRFGLPTAVVRIAMPGLAIAYAIASVMAFASLLRRGGLRGTLPALALAASQALWFAAPALARHLHVLQGIEPLGTEHSTYAFLWIAMAHSVQYLWITRYFARARGATSGAVWGAKALLSGASIWVVPALLFSPAALGTIPYDAGLGLLIASVVNVHHFVLDGAIWKLRDGGIARALLRGEGEDPVPEPGTAWRAKLVWGAGILSVGVWCLSTYEQARGVQQALAAGDANRVEAAARRLTWVGQESARVHAMLATLHQHQGRSELAETHARRALDLHADVDTLFELSTYLHRSGHGDDAIGCLERALVLDPESPRLRHRLAWLLVVFRREDPASAARARDLAKAAVDAAESRNASFLHTYGMALAATGDIEAALATAELALARAIEAGEHAFVDLLRRHRDGYAQALGRTPK